MALIKQEVAEGFASLPAVRQVGLMVGLAASVALGVAVVLWSQQPTFGLLYGNLADEEISQVLDALQQAGIPYKLDDNSGAILVPADDVYQARLKLASQGLPRGSTGGFDLLSRQQELGTSQFIEQARYHHALEVELARSISSLRYVKSARVHLAIPKRSVFLRKRQAPSASVVVELYPGRTLEPGVVESIVHLVSSSIPNLKPDEVTVVDQTGRLLTGRDRDPGMQLNNSQFEYTRNLERNYVERIEALLEPLVGRGRVRAQVSAKLDFTVTEQTRESFDPERVAIRSEQIEEDKQAQMDQAMGIPGALSNKPVPGGTLEQVDAQVAPEDVVSDRRRATRNYEVDRTISHTRHPSGRLERLSVAVLVDYRQSVDDKGNVQRVPLSQQELDKITGLVRNAVGFEEARGDSVTVLNLSFKEEALEPIPEPPLWEQPWFWNLVKQGLAALAVLFLIFGVLRPMMRGLAHHGAAARGGEGGAEEGREAQLEGPERTAAGRLAGPDGEGQAALPGAEGENPALEGPDDYQRKVEAVTSFAAEDPVRVAKVVQGWMANDE